MPEVHENGMRISGRYTVDDRKIGDRAGVDCISKIKPPSPGIATHVRRYLQHNQLQCANDAITMGPYHISMVLQAPHLDKTSTKYIHQVELRSEYRRRHRDEKRDGKRETEIGWMNE